MRAPVEGGSLRLVATGDIVEWARLTRRLAQLGAPGVVDG